MNIELDTAEVKKPVEKPKRKENMSPFFVEYIFKISPSWYTKQQLCNLAQEVAENNFHYADIFTFGKAFAKVVGQGIEGYEIYSQDLKGKNGRLYKKYKAVKNSGK